MSLSADAFVKVINGSGQIGPIGRAGDFGLTGAGATNESGAAFENVFLAAASAIADADEPDSEKDELGAGVIPPGDSLQNAAIASPPIPIVVGAELPPAPIARPPAGAVDSGQSAAIDAEFRGGSGVRAVATALQTETAAEPAHASTAENTVEGRAGPAQSRPLFSQQAEDASAARPGSPLVDQDISSRAINGFDDRGFDAARSALQPTPFGADDAYLSTDARSANAPVAAAVAANAPPGIETSVDRRIGIALQSAAGTKEASPPAITVVASRRAADGSIELRLDPPELGSVSIDLVSDETGAVRAVVNADRAETLDLLRRHIDIFKSELARNGFGEVDMTFGGGRQGGDEPPPRARTQQHWANHASAAFDDYAAFAVREGFDVIA
ncbi:MAG: flagellar hook-length control protein FliK [Pseudomonadota bacterium]